MATAKLPTTLPVSADVSGAILGIPKNEWTANGATTAGAAVPFSLVVNEAIDAGIESTGKLTTANGEVLHYSAVNTGTKTFTIDARAQEGTTAAAIDDGSAVGQYLTRDNWQQLTAEVLQMAKTGAGHQGADVASAAALNIGEDGQYFHVTGTTAITSIETRLKGQEICLVFDGALTLTHNATSLILRGAANVTTAAGDVFIFRSEGSAQWREIGRCTTSSIGGTFVGARCRRSTDVTWTASTHVAVPWDTEDWDTDGFHDNATNNTRLTIPAGKAGKYLITGAVIGLMDAGNFMVRLTVNGSANASAGTSQRIGVSAEQHATGFAFVLNLAAADYVEIRAYQNSAHGAPLIRGGQQAEGFTCVEITKLD